MNICDKEKCVGCFACMNVCPKNAIYVEKDKLKKTYACIDEEKCVNCGLCRKVCPCIHESEFVEPIECYAAWTNILNDRVDCASGGIATALSRAIIEKNGIVFGSAFDSEMNLNIEAAENIQQIEIFKGSKYVQSFTGNSYKKAKEYLENGKTVLYVGTPCQIDGLLHYLGKRYDNLYTVDIICHGVPPIDYLKEHINTVLPNERISSILFRGKNDYELVLKNEDNVLYQKHSYLDMYYHAFLKGMIFRDNCYSCRYAKKERVADISIGDFWGLDKSSLEEKYNGKISVILCNTKKGKNLLKQSGEYIHIETRNIAEAIKYNEQLKQPYSMPKDRKSFAENYEKGLHLALKQTSIGRDIRISEIKNSKIGMIVKRMIKKN